LDEEGKCCSMTVCHRVTQRERERERERELTVVKPFGQKACSDCSAGSVGAMALEQ
jgi:hypothetical protein